MLCVGLIPPGRGLGKHWCERSLSLALLSILGRLPAKASSLPVILPASVHAACMCNLLFCGATSGLGWLRELTGAGSERRALSCRLMSWLHFGSFPSLGGKTLGNVEKTVLAKPTVLSWTAQVTLITGVLFMWHYSWEHHLDKNEQTKLERETGRGQILYKGCSLWKYL